MAAKVNQEKSHDQIVTVSSRDLRSKLIECMSANTPFLLMGSPGVGKSTALLNIGLSLAQRVWVVISSLREPTDFSGLPVVSKTRKNIDGQDLPIVELAPPRFALEAASEGGIIFLDEITTTAPATQAALLRVIHERQIGDLTLGYDKVYMMAAANPSEMASGGNDLTAPLANRFAHAKYVIDVENWTEEFPGYWGRPLKLKGFGPEVPGIDEKSWSQARSLVAGYIRVCPAKLTEVPAHESLRGGPWPSPRTWDMASRLLASYIQRNANLSKSIASMAMTIGEGHALEFNTWLKDAILPDPWTLLKNPSEFTIPDKRPDLAFPILMSVVNAATSENKITKEDWLACWEIFYRTSQQVSADVCTPAIKTLLQDHQSKGKALPRPVKFIEPFLKILISAGLYSAGSGK